jgi:hypothetical protein
MNIDRQGDCVRIIFFPYPHPQYTNKSEPHHENKLIRVVDLEYDNIGSVLINTD